MFVMKLKLKLCVDVLAGTTHNESVFGVVSTRQTARDGLRAGSAKQVPPEKKVLKGLFDVH